MSTSHAHPTSGPAPEAADPPPSQPRETTEGTVYTVTGGDWDEVAAAAARSDDERIIVNMGPQHPSTHGVLRLILEIDGETVTEARCGIGYLHTCIEKNARIPHVDAGHHIRDPHGLPHHPSTTRRRTASRRRSCSASRTTSPTGPR